MSNPNTTIAESQNGAPASDEPNGAPAGAPASTPAPKAAVKPKATSKSETPVIEEVAEIGAHVVAEIAPGVKRWITGVTDGGRVLAADNAEVVTPMHTAAARELLANKAVRKAFPTAQIVSAE